MMRFQLKTLFLSIILSIGLGVGCTTSQTSSIDDEMLSEVEVTDEAFGEVYQASEDATLDLDEFDFSQGEASSAAGAGEGDDLDLDFDDFDFGDSSTAQTDFDSFSADEFADELDLDELTADEVVQTPEPPMFPVDPQVNELDLADSFEEPAMDEFVFEESSPAPLAAQAVEITDIRYLANQAGGTVVVDANRSLSYETRFNAQNGQYVIEIRNAILPERLKRPFLMKDFTGSFGSINAYQSPGEGAVRIVVQLKPGFNEEPALRLEGTSLVVVPPALSAETFASNTQTPGSAGASADRLNAPLGANTLEEFLMSNQKFEGKPISLQVRDADVRDVVSFISEESGANIVMSDQVTGNISLKLRRVPWDQALVSVMRAKNLGYIRQGNVLRISTMDELKKEAEAARDFLLAQKELAPTKVKVIPVNYANVESLQAQVKEFLSKDGKVVVDARSNSILITDREDILGKVTKLIAALDVQPNQVLIEGKIVEASEDFATSLGIRWGASGSPLTLSQTGGAFGMPLEISPRLNFAQGTPPLPNFMELSFGTLDFLGDLTAALHLAESDRTAKLISSPRVVVMNRDKAEIGQSSEVISLVTIPGASGGGAGGSFFLNQTENRLPVELKLSVTPQITSDGSVIMDIDVLRQFAGPVVAETTQSRPINSRTAKTKVLVRNGETSVIGGIYQTDEIQSDIGVPVLKDIPVLGWLFKSRAKEKAKNELLIFLTPRIMVSGQDNRAASL